MHFLELLVVPRGGLFDIEIGNQVCALIMAAIGLYGLDLVNNFLFLWNDSSQHRVNKFFHFGYFRFAAF
jgi:hypothetical protein